MKKGTAILCLLIVSTAVLFSRESVFPKLSGPYLGQKPPGMTPEIFAPGIVSTGLDELNAAFSPDGGEFYFCVRSITGPASIFQMKMKKGIWSEPRLLPFASRFGDIDISVSPAGDALLFSSLRPLPGSAGPKKDNDFWLSARQGDGWDDPVHLGPGIQSDSHDYYPVMTRSGAIYFSSQREGPATNDIYRSARKDGAYAQAVKLPEAVNTEYREFDPYVTPDEDLLLFASSRPGGQGSSDLYVCFRAADGAWTNAVSLGDRINSPGPEFCPLLSPDGKYLFFTSFRVEQGLVPETPFGRADFYKAHNLPGNGLGDIYWVDARVIEELRPQEALPAQADAGNDAGGQEQRVALATYVASAEQARAVRALARSIRKRGGNHAGSPIYVAAPDPGVFPAEWLKELDVYILPLAMDPAFMDYPLALKAFAAAQVEKTVKDKVDSVIWLDPGVIVLKSLADLELKKEFDAVVRPVTLANTIGIPPQSAPNDYWQPIYAETGLDYRNLVTLETIADPVRIQPYYNCEVFSFNPRLGIAAEWARLLTRFLNDGTYQKTVCKTFLRKLFLHQAVLSAVITSKVKPERIKTLPLSSGYPFSQHGRLPQAKQVSRLEDLAVVIFDQTWQKDEGWLQRIPSGEPLRQWLEQIFKEYLSQQAVDPR